MNEPRVLRSCLRCGRPRMSTRSNRLCAGACGNNTIRFTRQEMKKIDAYLASLDRRADHALPTGKRRGRGLYFRTPETLAKLRASVRLANARRRGTPRGPMSPETKAKISEGRRRGIAARRGAA
jgi:hypothetical protein